jgi:hypothetical protein
VAAFSFFYPASIPEVNCKYSGELCLLVDRFDGQGGLAVETSAFPAAGRIKSA